MTGRERITFGFGTVVGIGIGVHVYIWCKMRGDKLNIQQSDRIEKEDIVRQPTPMPTLTSVHRHI